MSLFPNAGTEVWRGAQQTDGRSLCPLKEQWGWVGLPGAGCFILKFLINNGSVFLDYSYDLKSVKGNRKWKE